MTHDEGFSRLLLKDLTDIIIIYVKNHHDTCDKENDCKFSSSIIESCSNLLAYVICASSAAGHATDVMTEINKDLIKMVKKYDKNVEVVEN